MQHTHTSLWHRMHDDESYKRVKYWLFHGHLGILVCILLVAGGNVLLRNALLPLSITSDTVQYVETAEFLSGEEAPMHGHRLLKPIVPVLMNHIASYTSIDLVGALVTLSIVFYFCLAILIYFFLHLFLHKREEAFIGTLLYIGSYPMLMYGLDLYTETGAWFFHLLGLYYAVRYYKQPCVRFVLLSAVAVTAGFLWKEYAALAGLALGIFILIAHISWKEKMLHMAYAAILALPILIGWQVYIYHLYDYTYLAWFIVGHGEPDATSQFSPFYMLKSLVALFVVGWLLVLGGLLKWRSFSPQDRTAGIVAGVTSLGFLSWGYVSSRLYFVLSPVLAVLAGRGSTWITSRTLRAVVVLGVLFATYVWIFIASTPAVRLWLQTL